MAARRGADATPKCVLRKEVSAAANQRKSQFAMCDCVHGASISENACSFGKLWQKSGHACSHSLICNGAERSAQPTHRKVPSSCVCSCGKRTMMNGEEGARRGVAPRQCPYISYISTASFERQSVQEIPTLYSIHRMLLLLLFRALWWRRKKERELAAQPSDFITCWVTDSARPRFGVPANCR